VQNPVERRGFAGQKAALKEQRALRQNLLEYFWELLGRGLKRVVAAAAMAIPLRTLQKWEKDEVETGLELRPLGRRPLRGSVKERNKALKTLVDNGPCVGVPTLMKLHPELCREELADIKKRYVRILEKRYKPVIRKLTWTRPGTVWAMDFTEPPNPMEEIFEQILLVEDLASGLPIDVTCLPGKTSRVVAAVLRNLFEQHGAPLVLKADNDSCFRSWRVRKVLEEWNVFLLLSPPRSPWYNGAVEHCIGDLKRFALYRALRDGRPSHWRCDDVSGASEFMRCVVRADGRTRKETFDERKSLTLDERIRFLCTYDRKERRARAKLGLDPYEKLGPGARSKVDRLALEWALVECGYLFFRSRRISPVKKKPNRAKIT
jgi:transposase InsO family protein